MAAPGYEFTAEQNDALTGLARRMRTVGTILIMVALLLVGQGLLVWKTSGSAVAAEAGAILVLIGIWSVRAGGEFSRIVSTQGADLSHLMRGLREIRRLYDLQFWAFVVLAFMVSLGLFAIAVGPGRITGPYP